MQLCGFSTFWQNFWRATDCWRKGSTGFSILDSIVQSYNFPALSGNSNTRWGHQNPKAPPEGSWLLLFYYIVLEKLPTWTGEFSGQWVRTTHGDWGNWCGNGLFASPTLWSEKKFLGILAPWISILYFHSEEWEWLYWISSIWTGISRKKFWVETLNSGPLPSCPVTILG